MKTRSTWKCLLTSTALFSLAIALNAADYSSTVLSHNPAGYWRLNETVPAPPGDVATNRGTLGAAAQGYYLAGAIHPVGGIPGAGADTAANMPNLNDGWGGYARVRIPNSTQINSNAPFSVEFWAKPAITTLIACQAASVDFTVNPRKG